MTSVAVVMNETLDNDTFYEGCDHHDLIIETWLKFSTLHLVRVLITWFLFAMSMAGNTFVLWSLKDTRGRHFIMFHLALSDLVFTLFVMPSDAIWNTTMEWLAGDLMCRVCQMMKQFGMYASSFMVVVIGVDRVTGILSPLPSESQRKRGIVMVAAAWIASLICCLPAGIIFSVKAIPTCEGIPIYQCVDFNVVSDRSLLPPYYFFTMCMSFVAPLISTLVSYSLIVCEITNMKERDRALMGRRNSVNTASIQKAKKKTILMRTLITLSFLVSWGPYYGKGIYDWFTHNNHAPPGGIDAAMYIAMYFNPVLHPIVFGIFLKEIRTNFYKTFDCFRASFLKHGPRKMSGVSRSSFSHSYATGTTQVHFSPGSFQKNGRLAPPQNSIHRLSTTTKNGCLKYSQTASLLSSESSI